jgi:alpha,alpha-trehalose-phosphate synthase [UDP-forming]
MGADNDRTDEARVSAIDDGSLIVVSNRQPYTHVYDDSGAGTETADGARNADQTDANGGRSISVNRPAGGLTAGLDPVLQRTDGTWIAWGDGDADRAVVDDDDTIRMPPEDPSYTLKRVWLTDEEIDEYYYGYSNRVLWPLCHGGVWQSRFAEEYWQQYQSVNHTFADAVIEQADADSLVWFQDYHFALAPQFVRAEVPEAFYMHFWHITWPGWDTFRACPQHRELLEGLLGNDLLGFHVERYCENFLDCVEETLDDAFIDREGKRVHYDDHATVLRAFPLGVDAPAVEEASQGTDREFWDSFRSKYDITSEKVALGVDRLDYTKGITERLLALEEFWETHPDWRGDLTYVQKANESRSLIPEYQDLQSDVTEAVDRINDRFGTDDWRPVVYLTDFLSQEALCGLYRYSDVMLVSAVRDGMNLVAKEFVAAQIDETGVLVLSDQTGAYEELGEDAVVINPYDTEKFVSAIERSLTMGEAERTERMHSMRDQVRSQDLVAWMNDVFDAASELRESDPSE